MLWEFSGFFGMIFSQSTSPFLSKKFMPFSKRLCMDNSIPCILYLLSLSNSCMSKRVSNPFWCCWRCICDKQPTFIGILYNGPPANFKLIGHSSIYLIRSTWSLYFSYGHTHQKAPDPVWSPKLSWWWRSQYCGGGPHGNTTCCNFFLALIRLIQCI